MSKPIIVGLPEGVTKIGIVHFDGQVPRVWWAFPDGSVYSTNMEGMDLFKTRYSFDATQPLDESYGFTQWHPIMGQARKLRYESGSIYPE